MSTQPPTPPQGLPQPSAAELERQKMAFIKKLAEILRKQYQTEKPAQR